MLYFSTYAILLKKNGQPPSHDDMVNFIEEQGIEIQDPAKLERFMKKRSSGDFDDILSKEVRVFSSRIQPANKVYQYRVVIKDKNSEDVEQTFDDVNGLFGDDEGY